VEDHILDQEEDHIVVLLAGNCKEPVLRFFEDCNLVAVADNTLGLAVQSSVN
jgi:hypothetical protein